MKSNLLPQLPHSQAKRLARVRHALEVEHRLPGEFQGKRLQCNRHLISIPLGRRWRALFVRTAFGYEFRDCLTHERYNKLNPAVYLL
jgi:hypothetical protein